jgi:hypothetical protein
MPVVQGTVADVSRLVALGARAETDKSWRCSAGTLPPSQDDLVSLFESSLVCLIYERPNGTADAYVWFTLVGQIGFLVYDPARPQGIPDLVEHIVARCGTCWGYVTSPTTRQKLSNLGYLVDDATSRVEWPPDKPLTRV